MIFEIDTGLEIVKSVFTSPCGTREVVGGSHQEFSKIVRNFIGLHVRNNAYFTQTASLVREVSMLDNNVPLLGMKRMQMNPYVILFSMICVSQTV